MKIKLTALVSFALLSLTQALPNSPYDLKFQPVVYTPPSIKEARDTLKNGIIVFLVKDDKLPLVDIKIKLRAGAFAEKKDESGISEVAFELLTEGGVKGISADSLSELLEFHAINMGAGAGNTEATLTASAVSAKTDLVLDLLNRLLLSPSFDAKKLEQVRKRLLDDIASRFDAPRNTVTILRAYGIYGKNSLTELLSAAQLKKISREKIIAYYSRMVKPENITIGVTGRFDKKEMKAKLEKSFGTFGTKGGTPFAFEPLKINPVTGFLFVEKPITQASVRLGLPIVQRPHPDYYPLTLMNWILGGAPFTSRIGKKVREEEGLAYSAGSGITAEYFYPGFFNASLETQSATAAYAISLVYSEIADFIKNGATAVELASAKQSLIDAFPATFESGSATVGAFLQNQFVKESDDRFDTYRDRIKAITLDDIKRVAATYLVTEKMTLCVVGDFAACDKGTPGKPAKLTDFGPVKKMTTAELSKLLGGE